MYRTLLGVSKEFVLNDRDIMNNKNKKNPLKRMVQIGERTLW